MTYLPDVNVWIALAAERHTLHHAARHWFSNPQDEKLAFCRLTQLGFLRLLTNKHVMQEELMRPDEAWEAYRVLRLDRRIGYLAEPNELPEAWQAFTESPLSSPNLWTDAYLCAFASALISGWKFCAGRNTSDQFPVAWLCSGSRFQSGGSTPIRL